MKSNIFVLVLSIFLLAAPCWAGPSISKGGAGVGAKSGSDATVITGTAGTDTYSAVWNADGDLVNGPGVPETDTHASEHNDGGADEIDRFTEGVSIQTFTDEDTSPDVSNGTSEIVRFWKTGNTAATTIDDFDDTDDHSEFTAGDWIHVLIDDSDTTFDFTSSSLKGHGGVDWVATADSSMLATFDGTNWICTVSEPSSFSSVVIGGFSNSMAVVSDGSGDLESSSTISTTELGLLNGKTNGLADKFPIYISVAEPDTMDARDFMPIFTNNTGASITIISIYAISDDDNTDFRIEEYDADGAAGEAEVKTEVCDTGSGPYTNDAQGTITNPTIENGHILVLDFDDTDTPDYLHITLWYTF